MKANNPLGDPKEVRAMLEKLGIEEDKVPRRPLAEILNTQENVLAYNFGNSDCRRWGLELQNLTKEYFEYLIKEFYIVADQNKRIHGKQSDIPPIINEKNWAGCLLYELLRTVPVLGKPIEAGNFLKNFSSIYHWAENNGFGTNIKGFAKSLKESDFCLRDVTGQPFSILFAVSYIEAILKTENMLKDEFEAGQFVFQSSEPEGYRGFTIVCPLFHDVSRIEEAMNQGDYFLRIVENEK